LDHRVRERGATHVFADFLAARPFTAPGTTQGKVIASVKPPEDTDPPGFTPFLG
jgi:hypothetical protein